MVLTAVIAIFFQLQIKEIFMKFMYNKKTLEGKYFYDSENYEGFTEKYPIDSEHIFNEELDDWVLPEINLD